MRQFCFCVEMINLGLDRDTMRMMMDHLDKVECEELTGTVWRVYSSGVE